MTTEKKTDFAAMKAGDRVWLGRTDYPKSRIRTVSKVTATQIVIAVNEHDNRFKRYGGWRIGGAFMAEHITALATPAECKAWDAKQEKERLATSAAQQKAEALEVKRVELQELFLDRAAVEKNCGEDDDRGDQWRVDFTDLTEQQVRELAALVVSFVARGGKK